MEREAKTRTTRIDPQLKAAGWSVVPFVPGQPLPEYKRAAVEEYATDLGPAIMYLPMAAALSALSRPRS